MSSSAAAHDPTRPLAGTCVGCYKLGCEDSLVRILGSKKLLADVYHNLGISRRVAKNMLRDTPAAVLASGHFAIRVCEQCAERSGLPKPHSPHTAPGVPTLMEAQKEGQTRRVSVTQEFEVYPVFGKSKWPDYTPPAN